jgi:putative tryptophan/tyrosine transport system substrate-binding protein
MSFDRLRRREFITLLGGAATWPLAARAQQPMPVIGFLGTGSTEADAYRVAAFRRGLAETGYVEGQNVAIEFRWAQNDNARLPELASGLVQHRVAVIATPFSTPAALAAKAATKTIPIVFSMGGDPVALGLVASLNRPGGNVTGLSYLAAQLTAKRVEFLHEAAPGVARIGLLVNRTNPLTESLIKDTRAAGSAVGLETVVLSATTDQEIDGAFGLLLQEHVNALMVGPDTLFANRRGDIALLAVRNAMPTIFPFRDDAEAGGLISYGANVAEEFRLVGVYTGRILKGEKPADLPIMQPTKFELVINLKTAKALGLTVPPTLLAIADEVIE